MSDMADKIEGILRQARTLRNEKRLSEAKGFLLAALQTVMTDEFRLEHREQSAKMYAQLGQIERDMGRPEKALKCYEQAAELYRAARETQKLAHTIRHLADIHQVQGNLGSSEACYEKALNLYSHCEKTPPLELANAVRGLALLKERERDALEARLLWEKAHTLYTVAEVEAGTAECSQHLKLLKGQPSHKDH